MRITQEADYALRLTYLLASAEQESVCDAGELAARAGITQSFALKILRKLSQAGLVRSVRGLRGGYLLSDPERPISMRDVIEAIEGPIEISSCLADSYKCSRMGCRKRQCAFHNIFHALNAEMAEALGRINIKQLAAKNAADEPKTY